MSHGHACPVCQQIIDAEFEVGAKIECPSCASVHRVRDQGGRVVLKVLIEALNPPIHHRAEPVAGEEKPEAVGPKLTTWKDRIRSETDAGSGRTRRKTAAGSRRRGR